MHCAICGSEEKVEYHHVKHIKKGEVTGFLQVMKQLNRKQIPCCKQCHKNIHAGRYDGMGLSQIYDEELIVI
jgi:predicted glycosyltransferase involved in capsule biosynthesis